ncbi:putative C6 finger domain protein [Bimuria novae-zelandiae CBS 107.79]|uniref:Putative C6 finger domain protein n=1 Tax=Bimuria novae-zelandiae CBS 107.79 TaxID=1447943 RepID=A0A6A5UVN5_9PLEO|nr:putative C6 finger domain protein [Bimuria novae-zelandiae CBS 107.79]
MKRRSHKKSRGGCLQCKRRDVKCDEQRPACRLYVVSNQTCSFQNAATSQTSSVNGHSSTVSDTSPNGHTETEQHSADIFPHITSQPDPALENAINLEHMELLLNFISTKDLFSLSRDREIHQKSLSISDILDTGLRYPYLLHQLFAFSARHLATIRPSRAGSYLHQAITLQTRAVVLFNTSYTPITQETCVPILLFSTALGHHVLTDTLSKRDAEDLASFIKHFVQCLETLKGVFIIFREARPFWEKSVLSDILSRSSSLTSRPPVGAHCQGVKKLVEASPNLNTDEKRACQEAIRILQIGYDAISSEHEEPGNQYQMLFLWCILVPREFIALIAAKNTEAMVVLGYYARLLRYGRAMWQVEDAGDYIFGLLRGEY